jgi:hypothetical protein
METQTIGASSHPLFAELITTCKLREHNLLTCLWLAMNLTTKHLTLWHYWPEKTEIGEAARLASLWVPFRVGLQFDLALPCGLILYFQNHNTLLMISGFRAKNKQITIEN